MQHHWPVLLKALWEHNVIGSWLHLNGPGWRLWSIFTPPELFLFHLPLLSATLEPALPGCSLGLLNGLWISNIVRKLRGLMNKVRQNDKCIKRERWPSLVSSLPLSASVCVCAGGLLWGWEQREHLTPAFHLDLHLKHLDWVQMRNEPLSDAATDSRKGLWWD